MPEDQLVLHLLTSMPEEYEQTVVFLRMQPPAMLTLSYVTNALMAAETTFATKKNKTATALSYSLRSIRARRLLVHLPLAPLVVPTLVWYVLFARDQVMPGRIASKTPRLVTPSGGVADHEWGRRTRSGNGRDQPGLTTRPLPRLLDRMTMTMTLIR